MMDRKREASRCRQRIANCLAELRRLAGVAQGYAPLVRGSLYSYRRRCGKRGCRCLRAQDWPIGSGIAEGAVKQFGMRLKGSEKFWNGFGFGKGAGEMLALCALHRSEDDRWRTYWDRRSLTYVREPKRETV